MTSKQGLKGLKFDAEDDDYFVQLLIAESKNRVAKYQSEGINAFLKPKQNPSGLKPNTIFLERMVKNAHFHNSALLRKETEESAARLKQLQDTMDESTSSRAQSRSPPPPRRRNALPSLSKRQRSSDQDSDQWDSHPGRLAESKQGTQSDREQHHKRHRADEGESKRDDKGHQILSTSTGKQENRETDGRTAHRHHGHSEHKRSKHEDTHRTSRHTEKHEASKFKDNEYRRHHHDRPKYEHEKNSDKDIHSIKHHSSSQGLKGASEEERHRLHRSKYHEEKDERFTHRSRRHSTHSADREATGTSITNGQSHHDERHRDEHSYRRSRHREEKIHEPFHRRDYDRHHGTNGRSSRQSAHDNVDQISRV
ncbi:hypothetical protein V1512DRAFT_291882 [Lipomyces arxii]|uniref:uncharacterized protein n=1 Tax=Lipomyces arxii TaxID=56418 RepID=UPI0034CFF86C